MYTYSNRVHLWEPFLWKKRHDSRISRRQAAYWCFPNKQQLHEAPPLQSTETHHQKHSNTIKMNDETIRKPFANIRRENRLPHAWTSPSWSTSSNDNGPESRFKTWKRKLLDSCRYQNDGHLRRKEHLFIPMSFSTFEVMKLFAQINAFFSP